MSGSWKTRELSLSQKQIPSFGWVTSLPTDAIENPYMSTTMPVVTPEKMSRISTGEVHNEPAKRLKANSTSTPNTTARHHLAEPDGIRRITEGESGGHAGATLFPPINARRNADLVTMTTSAWSTSIGDGRASRDAKINGIVSKYPAVEIASDLLLATEELEKVENENETLRFELKIVRDLMKKKKRRNEDQTKEIKRLHALIANLECADRKREEDNEALKNKLREVHRVAS